MNKEFLHIHNFKCFTEQTLEINNLTALVGVNGAGKSSAIQSLLLLRSSFEELGDEVSINGMFGLDLGTSSSLVNQNVDESTIKLSINDNSEECLSYTYNVDVTEDKLNLYKEKKEKQIPEGRLSLVQGEFHYLCAERRGPRVSQPLACMKYLTVGCEGQNVAQVMAHDGGKTKVSEDRMYDGTENPNLDNQVNAWLAHIMHGVRVSASMNIGTLTAQTRIGNDFTLAQPALATNFGFGVSYSLPIIVEALTARNDSMLIVENPEAHLHPAAQSAIGIFLARMAYAGLRVVVETHSDHVINGIQRFVAKNSEWHDNVTINHFSLDKESQKPIVTPITFDKMANYSEWPEGFMDQSQKDFIELCKVRG